MLIPELDSAAAPALTLPQANRIRYDIYRRGNLLPYRMSDEKRAARRAEYAARVRAHAAEIRAKRAEQRALTKEVDTARLAADVARIRSEIRLGVKLPAGKLSALDAAAMLLIGLQRRLDTYERAYDTGAIRLTDEDLRTAGLYRQAN